jgi:hypothetical protein
VGPYSGPAFVSGLTTTRLPERVWAPVVSQAGPGCGWLRPGTGGLVTDSVNLGLVGARWGVCGYLIGGIADAYERDALRNFVSDLVDGNFTGERRDRARQRIGLDRGTFGLPLDGQSRVFVIDSDTVPLAQWHREKRLDLYAMAGLLSFDSFDVVLDLPPYRTVVKLVGPDGQDSPLPVGRLHISRFLESDGQGWRLRVYALSRQAVAEHLATAKDKCQQLGIRINWNDGERFAWFRSYTQYEVTDEDDLEMRFGREPEVGVWAVRRGLRDGSPGDDCSILALGCFHTSPGPFGQTLGRHIDEDVNDTTCPDDVMAAAATNRIRTDRCCTKIERVDPDDNTAPVEGSGVIYRDVWPQIVFGHVLQHEIGHYVGLCHFGHNPANIMWTYRLGSRTVFAWRSICGFYRDSEPRFSLDDARNCWRFLVDEMPHCLAPDVEPVPVP